MRTASARAEALRSLKYETNGHKVICELLRLVYDEVEAITPALPIGATDAIEKYLLDAFIAAKKMDTRLHYYWKTYGDTTGHHGHHLRRIPGTAKRRAMRKARSGEG